MADLRGLVLLLTCCCLRGAAGHSLPRCREQLEFRCNDGSCIPRPSVCDGLKDCEDGSDEHGCDLLSCKKGEFSCRNRRCLSIKSLCDGIDNCGDGSDEAPCKNCTTPGFFSCGPQEACLPRNKLCDGQVDCKNGRDESGELCGGTIPPHPQTSSTCAKFEFQCGGGQCIRKTWRCDEYPDCPDGSDEENCAQNECEVNLGGCSHGCRDLERGFVCECPANMRLVEDNQCEDVDQCLDRDVCDQLCVHTNGSFTCDCHRDYRLNRKTGECKAIGNTAQLVFTSLKGMQMVIPSGSEPEELVPHFTEAGPVGASNRTVYWAQQRRGFIYRAPMDGNQKSSVIVFKTEGSVSGLAVDWIHQLLYWTSLETASISVGLLDGSAQRLLITGLDKPAAVAVDPLRGLLFWAECGSSPKIERAGLDSRERKTLVTRSVHHPIALCLDLTRQLLYWADQGSRSISRVNLDGHHRKAVVESNGYLDRPFGLAVFESFVYWSDAVTGSICRANKHNGRNLTVLLSNVTSPGGVVVVHPALQPNDLAACGRIGEVCRHSCVVDLLSQSALLNCTPPETGHREESQETPVISRTVPASTLSDPKFAGILSLIMFLSVLLVGLTLWWCREEFRPSRSLAEQSFLLKESQDPLINQGQQTGPNTSQPKETLLKLESDGE